MAGEWETVPLDSLIEPSRGISYGIVQPGAPVADGVPIVRVGDVRDGRVAVSAPLRVSPAVEAAYARTRLTGGELLLTLVGTVGEAAIVPASLAGWNTARAVAVIPVRKEIGAYWVKLALQAPGVREIIDSRLNTTVQATLNLGDVAKLPIVMPPSGERKAIAHILGTLDDKIELNRRMNETLEAMARALFKSWFVDFDPVRARVADLIRDQVLEIGDGYRAKNSELGETGLPFIRAGDLNNGFDTAGADLLREESVAKAGSKVCRVGDVAFTSKGTIGRFARVTEHTARFVYSPQVCYWRSVDPSRLHPVMLYCWMQSDELGEQIAAVAGQTDMAPYVSLQDQRLMTMPVFPSSQHTLTRRIEPLLARQSSNAAEAKTLSALRDTLLPKLISGELRVKDAGRVLEASAP